MTASQVVKALQANIREEHRCFLQLCAASVQGVSPALAAPEVGLSVCLLHWLEWCHGLVCFLQLVAASIPWGEMWTLGGSCSGSSAVTQGLECVD